MELVDSGKLLPDAMSLKLVAKKLSSETCQQRGWILDGLCNAGGAGELEEAIAAVGEVSLLVHLPPKVEDRRSPRIGDTRSNWWTKHGTNQSVLQPLLISVLIEHLSGGTGLGSLILLDDK